MNGNHTATDLKLSTFFPETRKSSVAYCCLSFLFSILFKPGGRKNILQYLTVLLLNCIVDIKKISIRTSDINDFFKCSSFCSQHSQVKGVPDSTRRQ